MMSLGIYQKLLIDRIERGKSRMDKTIDDQDHALNINRLFKAEEVAKLLNISRSFAYLLMHTGQSLVPEKLAWPGNDFWST